MHCLSFLKISMFYFLLYISTKIFQSTTVENTQNDIFIHILPHSSFPLNSHFSPRIETLFTFSYKLKVCVPWWVCFLLSYSQLSRNEFHSCHWLLGLVALRFSPAICAIGCSSCLVIWSFLQNLFWRYSNSTITWLMWYLICAHYERNKRCLLAVVWPDIPIYVHMRGIFSPFSILVCLSICPSTQLIIKIYEIESLFLFFFF